MKKSLLFIVLASLVLLACPALTCAEMNLLYEDDFNDGVISDFWRPYGNIVVEDVSGGFISIQENVTDVYTRITSKEFPAAKKLRLEMRHYMHRPNDFFFPGVNFYFGPGDSAEGFGLTWLRSAFAPDYCNIPDGFDKVMVKGSNQCFPSNLRSSDYYEKWLISYVMMDTETGKLDYDVNGDGSIDFTVTLPESLRKPITNIILSGYCWWTGSYHNIDYMRIYTDTAPTTQVNRPPVLSLIGNKTAVENQTIEFEVYATDPDGDALTFSSSNLPSGATFDPETHIFRWTPAFDQSGTYQDISFTVVDSGSPPMSATESIAIVVGNVNRPPEFATHLPISVTEGETVQFPVDAHDPDGNAITYYALGLPVDASFNPFTKMFTWKTSVGQRGNYIVRIYATDDGTPAQTGALEVPVTVGDLPAPSQLISQLRQMIVDYSLPKEVVTKYIGHIDNALKFLEAGKITPAIAQLSAMIGEFASDMKKGALPVGIGDSLTQETSNLQSTLQNQRRLDRIVEMVKASPVGQELSPYLDELLSKHAVYVALIPPTADGVDIFGKASTGYLKEKLTEGDTLNCSFADVYIVLNETYQDNFTLAAVLVHELTHYRDAVLHSQNQEPLTLLSSEVDAFANTYKYFEYSKHINERDFTMSQLEAMSTCYDYSLGQKSLEDAKKALMKASPVYTENYLTKIHNYLCTSGF